jgi:uncharacterized protein
VHRLYDEILEKFDCTACGNCCIELRPKISEKEIKKLSKILDQTPEQFTENYTEIDEGAHYLKFIPCSFLDGKKCSIYSDRPKECKSYPFLHKKDFTSRLWGIIDNYSICPIVFNVFERLKIQLNFR